MSRRHAAAMMAPFAVPADSQPVVNMRWGGIPVAPDWQVIGKWGQTIGNREVSLYPGPQRRNGVGDISSGWYMGTTIPTFTAQVPLLTPGTQRFVQAPARQGPSKYGKYQLQQLLAANQQQISGPLLPSFEAQLNQQGPYALWPNYPSGGQP